MAKLHRRGVLAGAVTLAATRSIWAQGGPKKGGMLKVSAPTNPSSLDPATGGSGQDHAFLYPIFDTLVAFDYKTLKAEPGLAESWKFTDPRTLVLNIRSGIAFHDGTPLDAEAVKFNLERNRSDPRSSIKADLITVESIEVSGPMAVTMKLKQPDSALPLILSDRAGMMASPKAVMELGKDHDRKPVGTGPYKCTGWNDNEKVVYARNDKYWKPGQPLLDGMEFAVIAETNTGLRSTIPKCGWRSTTRSIARL
jgi:ABC-type transport system substrate-binding protein